MLSRAKNDARNPFGNEINSI